MTVYLIFVSRITQILLVGHEHEQNEQNEKMGLAPT